jgi:hypothetical protein
MADSNVAFADAEEDAEEFVRCSRKGGSTRSSGTRSRLTTESCGAGTMVAFMGAA